MSTCERLVSKKELAERLGVCQNTVDSLRSAGYIAAVRIGNRVKFEQSEVERFIESRKIPSKSAS